MENLRLPAKIFVDPKRNEAYVADSYANHRVIVFDAGTGKYKRHWGAYGKKPSDEILGPTSRAARRRTVPQSRTLRDAFQRRSALCLRPRQRPYTGFQTRWDVRERSVHRAADARVRVGLGYRRSPRTRNRNFYTSPTARIARYISSTATLWRYLPVSATAAAARRSSMGSTVSRPTRRGTSTPPRHIAAKECRSSSSRDWLR